MILLTAFNAFGSVDTNASEVLLRALGEDSNVVRVVLRTEYEAGSQEIIHLIRNLKPQLLICFGVSEGDTTVRLERVARNWDGAVAPDNVGDVRYGQPIIQGAPAFYLGTISYDAISTALRDRGVAHLVSEDAGGFVCNHVFFRALHEITVSESRILCGFIHLPPLSAQGGVSVLLDAMRSCIDAAMSST